VRYQFLYNYVLWVIFGIILYILSLLLSHSSSLFFLITSLYLLILPGYLIWRLLRIPASGMMRLIIFFVLGLAFYLLINLVAVLIGINIDQLIKIYEIILPLLFLAALFFDFLKPFQEESITDWKKIWRKENIIYLVPIILSIFIFLVIEAKGADFNGDPYYHLAIVRKAIEGSKLNPASLVFSQTGSSNPAYAYPAWHIFVAGLARILDVDIFTTWSKLILPLTLFSFISWFLLSKAIFEKRSFTIVAFIFFLGFTFFSSAGYLFQRLTMPDTLAQYLLMPMAFVSFLNYLAQNDSKGKWGKNIVYLLLLVSLLIVHAIHYFYILSGIILFSLIYLIVSFKDRRQIITGLGLTLVPFAIVAVVMEIQSGFITETLRHFSGSQDIAIAYANFQNIPLMFKYALLLSPLLLLFIKKQKGMILLFALMILVPLVYWTPLKSVASRALSFVFTDRLMGNVTLYYFVYAALITFFLAILSNVSETLSKKVKLFYYFLLLIIVGLTLALEILHRSVSHFFEIVFYTDAVSIFLDQYWQALLGVIVLVTLFGIFWQKVKKNSIAFVEMGAFNTILFSAFLGIILFSPSAVKAWQEVNNARLSNLDARSHIINDESLDGNGWQYLEGIPKTVVLADDEGAKELSTLVNHYMAYNLSSASEEDLMAVFYPATSDEEKIELILSPIYKIDYVYLRPAYVSSASFFEKYPKIFDKVYDGEAKIYKVIK